MALNAILKHLFQQNTNAHTHSHANMPSYTLSMTFLYFKKSLLIQLLKIKTDLKNNPKEKDTQNLPLYNEEEKNENQSETGTPKVPFAQWTYQY